MTYYLYLEKSDSINLKIINLHINSL